ncbi:Nitrogen-fixing NifU domain-containing protein [Spironucleus salmonicida]|uniref:Nitrogen-fixing NifU domain-containing protein n=1 Tax=Spironucleus salmonicida TaxID=348837 RepID=K7REJ5_9EUKA|nr:nitrogen-fixing NifU domain-containing protein [Spironucleus salmonicida]KAH0572387.1 Nitrogen-fixing NifU domain-containing protein [Spironucleus salmonicida]|eukprot:EST41448.1 Nitrogen-fixing NifU domain-containing protein [Spironucleus salmonicida]
MLTLPQRTFQIVEFKPSPSKIQLSPDVEIPNSLFTPLKNELKSLKSLKITNQSVTFTMKKPEDKELAFESLQKHLNPDFVNSTEEMITKINKYGKDTKGAFNQLLRSAIWPILNRDGGSCELLEIKEGIAYLKLTGACGSCPSSTGTIKNLIERLAVEFVEGIKEVQQV